MPATRERKIERNGLKYVTKTFDTRDAKKKTSPRECQKYNLIADATGRETYRKTYILTYRQAVLKGGWGRQVSRNKGGKNSLTLRRIRQRDVREKQ